MQRVGVDTGGTFTDAVCADGEGGFVVCKRPTTVKRPSDAVLETAEVLAPPAKGGLELVHGTTHATNALLTGKLGKVVFITNQGFGDLLAIGRQERPVLYDLKPKLQRPQQSSARVVEVNARMNAAGKTVTALTRQELARVKSAVAAKQPQAVAVCLLHSFRNSRHELQLGKALKSLGVPVVLSSELVPEYREFERATTTWADAGLQSVVGPALKELAIRLRQKWGNQTQLRVMRSDGGTADAQAAAIQPVHLALSGPAGGLAAARSLADARGDADILTLDMGGTSTDVALLGMGELPLQAMKLAGLPLLARGLPVHTVGTGGGSLASFDAAGELVVGPDSAGAVPGPVCYGKGGKQVTVTDAHLVAGHLHPRAFLGGEFPLDVDSATFALKTLGATKCWSTVQTAAAVLEVASAEMERALRKVSLADGHDPRRLVLYAFGGAGGLHAAAMAERLGMKEVVIPPHPGAFSALGLLSAPARRSLAQTVLQPLPSFSERRILFSPLVAQAKKELQAEGVSFTKQRIRRIVELRSQGQAGEFALADGPRLVERFHAEHQRRFGYVRSDAEILLVSVRVQADGPAVFPWKKKPTRRHAAKAFDRGTLLGCGKLKKSKWYQREDLKPGAQISGPALIAEYSGTTVIPPGWGAVVDGFQCIRMTAKKGGK